MSSKVKIGAGIHLYPLPMVMVGSQVGGKPNFITVGYVGIVQHTPPMVSIALGKAHYSNDGIKESGSFSINLPNSYMVEITDHVGLKSGRVLDKSQLFEIFYGELGNAPMINEVPLCLECKLEDVIDLKGTNELFLGRIVQTYVDPVCLTNGTPDIVKLDPFVFSMNDNNYWKIGDKIGKAWEMGERYSRPN